MGKKNVQISKAVRSPSCGRFMRIIPVSLS